MWQAAAAEIGGKIVGSLIGGKSKRGPSLEDQLSFQHASIMNGMRSQVLAAKENGIHPLYALGAPNFAMTPMQVGGEGPTRSQLAGDAISSMGQNIGAALYRSGTKEERAMAAITGAQAVRRGDLENELLESQIAQIRASMTPAYPSGTGGQIIPGQTGATTLQVPTEHNPKTGFFQSGSHKKPIFQVMEGPSGPMLMMSDDYAKYTENDPIGGYGNLLVQGLNYLPKKAADAVLNIFNRYKERR